MRTTLALIALSVCAQAQVDWTLLSPVNKPLPRSSFGACYDSARDELVVYGGFLEGENGFQLKFNDIWVFDGASWIQRTVGPRPDNNFEPRMVFDSSRSRGVLFGGSEGGPFEALSNQTWEWDGIRFTKAQPAQSPPPRRWHGLAYDPDRQRTVLYGGIDSAGSGGNSMFDTWEWDGANWTQVLTANSPPPLHQHRMVFARTSAGSGVYLFGGLSSGSGLNSDTWFFDGTDWSLVNTSAPPPARALFGMAYDEARRRIVVAAGNGFGGLQSDTWELTDQLQWIQRTASVYPTVVEGDMVYRSADRSVLFFGGQTIGQPFGPPPIFYARTHRYATQFPASVSTSGSGCGPVFAPRPVGDPEALPWTGETFSLDIDGLNPSIGVAFLIASAAPIAPLDLTGFGAPGCTLYVDLGVAVTVPLSASGGSATLTLPITANPSFWGGTFHLQAYQLDPGANPLGLTWSDAGAITLGGK